MADQSAPPTNLLDADALARAEGLPPDKLRDLIFIARAQLHELSLKINGHDHEAVSALIHASAFASQSDALATGAPAVPERYRPDVVASIRRWVQDTDLRLVGAIGPSVGATDALQREALVDWLESVANQVRREGRDVDLATDNAIRGWRIHTTAERHALLEASRTLVRQAIVAMSNKSGRPKRGELKRGALTAPEAREALFAAVGLDADDETSKRNERRRRRKPPGQ